MVVRKQRYPNEEAARTRARHFRRNVTLFITGEDDAPVRDLLHKRPAMMRYVSQYWRNMLLGNLGEACRVSHIPVPFNLPDTSKAKRTRRRSLGFKTCSSCGSPVLKRASWANLEQAGVSWSIL